MRFLNVMVLLGVLASASNADVYNIDPSWTVQEINALLDNDPGTLAQVYGSAVPTGGDVVSFAAGEYHAVPSTWFTLRAGGEPDNVLTIAGAGWGKTGGDSTIFWGSDAAGQPVWQVLGNHLHFRAFSVRDAGGQNTGMVISTADIDRDITLEKLWTISDFDSHFSYDHHDVPGVPNPAPGIRFENVYMQSDAGPGRYGTGIHTSSAIGTEYTEPIAIEGVTAQDLDLLHEAPIRVEPGNVIIVIGQDYWVDNLTINSKFTPDWYPPQSDARGVVTAYPESTMETAGGPTLYSLGLGTDLDKDGVPDFNHEYSGDTVDLLLDQLGRPTPGSPLLCEQVGLPDGREICTKGYIGAVAPGEPIPTVGAWGLGIMGLGVVAAGTALQRRRTEQRKHSR